MTELERHVYLVNLSGNCFALVCFFCLSKGIELDNWVQTSAPVSLRSCPDWLIPIYSNFAASDLLRDSFGIWLSLEIDTLHLWTMRYQKAPTQPCSTGSRLQTANSSLYKLQLHDLSGGKEKIRNSSRRVYSSFVKEIGEYKTRNISHARTPFGRAGAPLIISARGIVRVRP